jgi:hypothetical protein
MLINEIHSNMINSPVRSFQGKVERYSPSLAATYTHRDVLKSFKVERVGEGKFFGYGYVQKINIKLLDPNRQEEITTSDRFRLFVGVNDDYVTSFPWFKVTEVNRDEKTNELSITAYDKLKAAADTLYGEIDMTSRFVDGVITLKNLALAIAQHLGLGSIEILGVNDSLFETKYYADQINLDGSESLRFVLNAIAEVTHTIYYIDNKEFLVFKRLDKDGDAVLTIDKSKYMELDSKTNRRLAKITKATELGDNISVALTVTGTNQICMDNPFYELRNDVAALLEPARTSMLGLCINQFECEWRGNYLLEIGDKIDLVTKDNNVVTSYLLDDTFEYNGGIEQESQWAWDDTLNEDEENSAPTTLGDAINRTYAKVNKVEQQIDLVVKGTEENTSKISQLTQTVDGFKTTVQAVQQELAENEQEMQNLTQRVEATITAEEVDFKISTAMEDGVNKVTTETGFTFDATGLHVSKSGTEMNTTITEDGMTVYKDKEAMLTANNQGVRAANLHAVTYLIIGRHSRLEDYDRDGDHRTGCFWVGDVF